MKIEKRIKWILEYIEKQPGSSVDILNRDFVDDYAEATKAKLKITAYGANKCPRLALDLRAAYRFGELKRHRCGIEGMAGMGFPRWVWSYTIGASK